MTSPIPTIPPPQPGDSSSMWVKPKVRQRRAIVNMYGCLLGIAMLLSGLLAGIFGTYLFAPVLYGWNVTQTAIWNDMNQTARADAEWFGTQNAALIGTAGAQALTADAVRLAGQDNDTRATEIVLMMNMTQAALSNELALLESTATQSSANMIATRTADAANNAQQMTQIALDYAATQASLQQNATQVELDFQQTQASIDRNATEISSDNSSSAIDVTEEVAIGGGTERSADAIVAAAVDPTDTPAPTETLRPTETATIAPSATQNPTATTTPTPEPTATDVPTLTNTPSPTATLNSQVDISELVLSDAEDWQFDEDGTIRALTGGAWLQTEQQYRGDFVLSLQFLPAYQPDPEYFILLNVPERGNGLLLRLQANGLQVRSAGLYQFPVDLLAPPVNLTDDDLRELTRQPVSLRLRADNALRVAWQGNTLAVLLNDEPILQSSVSNNPPEGAVGVLVPAGVRFSEVAFVGVE